MSDSEVTPAGPAAFDPSRFPADSLFHERRERIDLAEVSVAAPAARRVRPERRKRIDPTTFEKQYTADELDFMVAMQRFKVQSGKAFPSFRDVIRVAATLGYRRPEFDRRADDGIIDHDDEVGSTGLAHLQLVGRGT